METLGFGNFKTSTICLVRFVSLMLIMEFQRTNSKWTPIHQWSYDETDISIGDSTLSNVFDEMFQNPNQFAILNCTSDWEWVKKISQHILDRKIFITSTYTSLTSFERLLMK